MCIAVERNNNMSYITDEEIANMIEKYEHTKHRCGFCKGIKNEFAKDFYIQLRRLDVPTYIIQELRKEECKCYRIEYN